MALATPECNAPIRMVQSSRVMKRSATRLPVAGVVSVSAVMNVTWHEYATFGVDLVDRHLDAAEIILAAVAVLTAGIAGQAKLDRFRALRPGMILPPRPKEAAGAADDTRHQAALQNASP